MREVNFIDLFSGCGGLSYGLEMNKDFTCQLGLDIDKNAIDTFNLNHKHSVGFLGNIQEVSPRELAKKLNGEIDLIVGGPPCQGFSLTGPRNFEDSRNSLYKYFMDTVKYFKPKAFLIENVPGLAHMWKGVIREDIEKQFTKLGYNVVSKIVTAADYGVPQLRNRLVFIGLQKNVQSFYEFPQPLFAEDKFVTCEMAISDLPSLDGDYLGEEIMKYERLPISDYQKIMRKGSSSLFNHVAAKHTADVKNVIALVPEGGNHKDLPKGIGESRRFNEAWTRYHSQKPSKTIDTGHRNHFHYLYNRVPTVRENARLQSFPDRFKFLGNKK